MYKSGLMVELSVETVAADRDFVFCGLDIRLEAEGYFLLLRGKVVQLCVKRLKEMLSVVAFDNIQTKNRLLANTREDNKMCAREYGDYSGSEEIVAISETFKLSVSIYFVSEGQITQPPTARLIKL
jgi:hypothetical protein